MGHTLGPHIWSAHLGAHIVRLDRYVSGCISIRLPNGTGAHIWARTLGSHIWTAAHYDRTFGPHIYFVRLDRYVSGAGELHFYQVAERSLELANVF